MNGLFELHLILQELFNLSETVTNDDFKLFFLNGQYLSLSGMFFDPAVL
jgi:hypothetical protein